MSGQLRAVGTILLAGLATLGGGRAADAPYPRVNVATAYVVDPNWPQKPADYHWGPVPGIAVDAQDRVYVFTRAQPPVQVYRASDGKLLMAWGQGIIGSAHHIKIGPDGHVWVADIGHHQVMKFTPEGKLLLAIGTKGHPGCDATHLDRPTDMAITLAGDVFVSDGYGNARIVHFNKDGKYVKEWGTLGSKPGQFSIPHAIAVDPKGRLYVADRNNVRVQVFDQDGRLLDVWHNLVTPWGFHVEADGTLWVCGSSPMQWRATDNALGCPPKDQLFMRFDPSGKLLQLWTVPKGIDGLERPGECNWVHAIATDSQGNIYVGDIVGKRAQKFVKKQP
ncbi:MAG: peptidyl-alpha-hydroxyglycine alpha-amidating lyase family protein [Gemmataceae bacterium]|nr:peptidyl-alpha-hydroxyglycine alpha-amidating lyase family protein [Gemmataceae bacterium]MDW8266576.1 peptidyl-alpha-hydroxyglycine alpha-amidating lyase family protein [Gemmataceae bacterium]